VRSPMRALDLPDLSGLTLLVVDDNDDALEMLTTFLTACDAQVLMARTASAALAYIETTAKIDALITDLSMPHMDGIELIQRVRRHPSRHLLPAIALTGFQERYMDARGFDAFLQKPANLDQLCTTIRSVIEARRL
jgi:two-component system CheB/CheR fusion protein